MMQDYIGRRCKIHIKRQDNDLFYEAEITDVFDNLFSFKDKFGRNYVFRIVDIIEVAEIGK